MGERDQQSERTPATMATTEEVQEALQRQQTRVSSFLAQASVECECTVLDEVLTGTHRPLFQPEQQNDDVENDVAEETMSATVMLAEIDQPTAECQSMSPSERKVVKMRPPTRAGRRHRHACHYVVH